MEGFVNQLKRSERQVDVGEPVIYTDEHRRNHHALITCVHGESYPTRGHGLQKESIDFAAIDEVQAQAHAECAGQEGRTDPRWRQEGPGETFDQHPCVNLVFVVDDGDRQDDYGRQIERYTSVSHSRQQTGGGFCWRFPDEERPVSQPVRS